MHVVESYALFRDNELVPRHSRCISRTLPRPSSPRNRRLRNIYFDWFLIAGWCFINCTTLLDSSLVGLVINTLEEEDDKSSRRSNRRSGLETINLWRSQMLDNNNNVFSKMANFSFSPKPEYSEIKLISLIGVSLYVTRVNRIGEY